MLLYVILFSMFNCLQNDKNESTIYKLIRDYSIDMTFTMEPESFTYYVIQNKDE